MLQFIQGGNTDIIPGSDGKTVARITCFKYNKLGHLADFCPNGLEASKHRHTDADKLGRGSTRNISSNEGVTERNVGKYC